MPCSRSRQTEPSWRYSEWAPRREGPWGSCTKWIKEQWSELLTKWTGTAAFVLCAFSTITTFWAPDCRRWGNSIRTSLHGRGCLLILEEKKSFSQRPLLKMYKTHLSCRPVLHQIRTSNANKCSWPWLRDGKCEGKSLDYFSFSEWRKPLRKNWDVHRVHAIKFNLTVSMRSVIFNIK